MKVEHITTVSKKLKITGATLLSASEYEEYYKNIPGCKEPCWLRSEYDVGAYNRICSKWACFVYPRSCCFNGDLAYFGNCGIRPALCIDLDSSDLKIRDKFKLSGYTFTIISKNYALCDGIINKCAFDRSSEEEFVDYNASDAKKVVDAWFYMINKDSKSSKKTRKKTA